MENWKPLNAEGRYLVSSLGRVWATPHVSTDGRSFPGRFVKCTASSVDGYVRFNFQRGGVKSCMTLHRAVAELFVPNPKNKPEVNHINGNKRDNRAVNLEWVTPSENQAHALALGLRKLTDPSHSRRVGAFNIHGELVQEFPSVAEAHRVTQIPLHALYRCCSKGTLLHGYIWRHL